MVYLYRHVRVKGLRDLYTRVRNSIIHNSYGMETTQVATGRRVHRQNVVQIHGGTLLSPEKEGSAYMGCRMGGSRGHVKLKESRHKRTNTV